MSWTLLSHDSLESKIDEAISKINQIKKQKESTEKSQRMKSKILADSTVQKALKIVRTNKVSKINLKKFSVIGTSNNIYHVLIHDRHGLVCINTEKNAICNGWKFKKNCKHCEAVRIFCKNNKILIKWTKFTPALNRI